MCSPFISFAHPFISFAGQCVLLCTIKLFKDNCKTFRNKYHMTTSRTATSTGTSRLFNTATVITTVIIKMISAYITSWSAYLQTYLDAFMLKHVLLQSAGGTVPRQCYNGNICMLAATQFASCRCHAHAWVHVWVRQ